VREAATICPRPCKLTFDLLTLKVVSESRVTWATSVPILVFLGLSVLDLGPMYATDRRQTSDAHHRLMPPTLGAGHNNHHRTSHTLALLNMLVLSHCTVFCSFLFIIYIYTDVRKKNSKQINESATAKFLVLKHAWNARARARARARVCVCVCVCRQDEIILELLSRLVLGALCSTRLSSKLSEALSLVYRVVRKIRFCTFFHIFGKRVPNVHGFFHRPTSSSAIAYQNRTGAARRTQ